MKTIKKWGKCVTDLFTKRLYLQTKTKWEKIHKIFIKIRKEKVSCLLSPSIFSIVPEFLTMPFKPKEKNKGTKIENKINQIIPMH